MGSQGWVWVQSREGGESWAKIRAVVLLSAGFATALGETSACHTCPECLCTASQNWCAIKSPGLLVIKCRSGYSGSGAWDYASLTSSGDAPADLIWVSSSQYMLPPAHFASLWAPPACHSPLLFSCFLPISFLHCMSSTWSYSLCYVITLTVFVSSGCVTKYHRLGILHTATAKSLQSCPTLCDPIDGSPPGSLVPGILQARTLEWVAISFSNAWKWKVKKVKSEESEKWSHSVVSDS